MPSGFVKNFSQSTIVFRDGTGTPLTHTATTDVGDLAIGGLLPGLRASSNYERKGAFKSAGFTTRSYPTVSLSFQFAEFTDTSSGTLADFIFATSGTPYAARVSTIAPSGATAGKIPFACDIVLTIEGTNYGDSADHTITLNDVKITSFDFAEGDPNSVSLTGEILGAISGDLGITEA